ncbi:hypothetical protein HY388_02675 [Candidatus Daviesbacteria bacterium]|nr:hypothetical protein [Candidatus Daviesbacteria bacterium]
MVYTENGEEALNLTLQTLGVSRNDNRVPSFYHPLDKQLQQDLTGKFGTDKRAVRTIPFTSDPWPQAS